MARRMGSEEWATAALAEIAAAKTVADVEALRVQYLGGRAA